MKREAWRAREFSLNPLSPSPPASRGSQMIRWMTLTVVTLVASGLVPGQASAGTNCWGKVPQIIGTPEEDVLAGREFFDVIHALGGNDFVFGDGIATGPSVGLFDYLCGGSGSDFIAGGGGDDKIRGQAGLDRIYGEDGADILRGGNGDDLIYDGKGVDTIDGGGGWDIWFKCLDGVLEESITNIEVTIVGSCNAPTSEWH